MLLQHNVATKKFFFFQLNKLYSESNIYSEYGVAVLASNVLSYLF